MTKLVLFHVALKIHVSESTVSLLKKNKNKYKYTERGIINLKVRLLCR